MPHLPPDELLRALREIRIEANQRIPDNSIDVALREMRSSLEWIGKRAERALAKTEESNAPK